MGEVGRRPGVVGSTGWAAGRGRLWAKQGGSPRSGSGGLLTNVGNRERDSVGEGELEEYKRRPGVGREEYDS